MDMNPQPLYDTSAVESILPHRAPFLLVDRGTELVAGERITAERDLRPEEPWFFGHFPGNPILPGVLVSEALAQTSGLLLGLTWKSAGNAEDPDLPRSFYLAAVNMKFSSPARPGETLRLEASIKRAYGKLCLFDAAAYAEERRIAAGTLTLAQGA
jgi:3-hydroxymyristoyl/3-hydroxydecanoyl-(acyl carrier protein) dehydratase